MNKRLIAIWTVAGLFDIVCWILLITFLTGCGKQSTVVIPPQVVYEQVQNLEGFYQLPDGGFLEIVNDPGNLQDIIQVRLAMRNADNSTGLIPLVATNNLPMISGKVILTTTLTYSATQNIKNDVGNVVLIGALLTTVNIFKHNDKLRVRVQVNSATGLVFDHTVEAI